MKGKAKKKNPCGYSEEIKETVKEHYRGLITRPKSSCCGPSSSCRGTSVEEKMRGGLAPLAGYGEEERSQVPEEAYLNSFGCGNPVAFTEVKEGDVVLDLGSGAGLDVLLAAKKVGPKGKVIGLDMTPEMIEKARENARKAGARNVEFKLGEMEEMPVADASVDWVISNCVINLSPDKKKVFQEVYRVLKPNGKMVVSDIVAEGIPEKLKGILWSSCVGGALDEASYLRAIRETGLKDVRVVDRLDYDRPMIQGLLGSGCLDLPPEVRKQVEEDREEWKAKISSIRVSGKKI